MQIGVDIGGTFTDIVALHRDGRLTLAKAILRLKVDVVEIRSPDQLERAIAGIAGQGTAAVVAADPNVLNQARRI